MEVLAALGIGVPAHDVLVAAAGDVDPGLFAGDRVVVKVVPGLVHKTEAGGVTVVPSGDASAAIEQMASRVPDAMQFLVAEYVEHPAEPGGELLAGMRWTDAFGPIVTLGPGGTATEFLAELMGRRPRRSSVRLCGVPWRPPSTVGRSPLRWWRGSAAADRS